MLARHFIKRCMAYILFKIVSHRQKLPNRDVLNSFKKKYTNASYVSWKAVHGHIWAAFFLRENRELKAYFKEDGSWIKTWVQIPLGNVPKRVSTGLYNSASNHSYKATFRVDTPQGIYYEFRTSNLHPREIARFDIYGKLVEKSTF